MQSVQRNYENQILKSNSCGNWENQICMVEFIKKKNNKNALKQIKCQQKVV